MLYAPSAPMRTLHVIVSPSFSVRLAPAAPCCSDIARRKEATGALARSGPVCRAYDSFTFGQQLDGAHSGVVTDCAFREAGYQLSYNVVPAAASNLMWTVGAVINPHRGQFSPSLLHLYIPAGRLPVMPGHVLSHGLGAGCPSAGAPLNLANTLAQSLRYAQGLHGFPSVGTNVDCCTFFPEGVRLFKHGDWYADLRLDTHAQLLTVHRSSVVPSAKLLLATHAVQGFGSGEAPDASSNHDDRHCQNNSIQSRQAKVRSLPVPGMPCCISGFHNQLRLAWKVPSPRAASWAPGGARMHTDLDRIILAVQKITSPCEADQQTMRAHQAASSTMCTPCSG